MTTVTQSVLRRFAERSLEIFARHAEDGDPQVAAAS